LSTETKRPRGRPKKIEAPAKEYMDLLTKEEIARIEAKVAAEDKAAKKKQTEEQYAEFLRDQKRRAEDPQEEEFDILIDVAPYTDRIVIDGREFFHGVTYTVPRSLFESLRDIIFCSWKAEEETGGANREFYKKPREIRIGPKHVGVDVHTLNKGSMF
jgi:hypothetical protein